MDAKTRQIFDTASKLIEEAPPDVMERLRQLQADVPEEHRDKFSWFYEGAFLNLSTK